MKRSRSELEAEIKEYLMARGHTCLFYIEETRVVVEISGAPDVVIPDLLEDADRMMMGVKRREMDLELMEEAFRKIKEQDLPILTGNELAKVSMKKIEALEARVRRLADYTYKIMMLVRPHAPLPLPY